MLESLGRRMAAPSQKPIGMATVSKSLDIPIEHMIEAPHKCRGERRRNNNLKLKAKTKKNTKEDDSFGGMWRWTKLNPC
jgi:hypothetical protein